MKVDSFSTELKVKYMEFLKQWSLEESGSDNIFCFDGHCLTVNTLTFVNQLLEEYVSELHIKKEPDYKSATVSMDLSFHTEIHDSEFEKT